MMDSVLRLIVDLSKEKFFRVRMLESRSKSGSLSEVAFSVSCRRSFFRASSLLLIMVIIDVLLNSANRDFESSLLPSWISITADY